MNYDKYILPAHPTECDVWTRLASEKRPIVVWGMGNGADKLLERIERYGIRVSDFFASDGFVRGQLFHGYRVKSFAEIRSEYPEFVIVVSFASAREEVLELLLSYAEKYTVIIPDMPVAGEEYFDRDFYNANYEKIKDAYHRLADDYSRAVFASVVNYKLTGDPKPLFAFCSEVSEMYGLLPTTEIREIIDAGAYNGDTVREGIEYFPSLRRAIAIEPDPRTFKRLARYAEGEERIELEILKAAAWSVSEEGHFISSGNRNSSVSSTASHEHRLTDVELVAIDCLEINPDYIKYDVEGAEMEALRGSEKAITESRPSLLVSLYHRSADLFEIIGYLAEKYPFYRLYLRRKKCFPAWELNLIAVPDFEE